MYPAAMSAIIIGTKNGLIRWGPPVSYIVCICRCQVHIPPIPDPKITPICSRSSFSRFRQESFTAISAHAMAYWVKRSIRFNVFLSMKSSGLNPLTSQAIFVSYRLASKLLMIPAPHFPATEFSQNCCALFPIGVTAPMPVTTTRRRPSRFVFISAPCRIASSSRVH